MAKWQQSVQEWTRAELISPEQAERILAFEAARPPGHRLLTSFIALGTSVIGIGVISLIAANWHAIPDAVKLGSDFLLLLALATAIWQQRNREHPLILDALLTLFVIACLASQGLISQIYHLQGTLDQALLLWAVITLPVITLAHRGFLPFVWSVALLTAITYRLTLTPLIPLNEEDRLLLIGYGMPLACALVALILRHWRAAQRFANAFRECALLGAVGMIVVVDFTSMLETDIWHWEHAMTWTGIVLGSAVLLGIRWRAQWNLKVKSLTSLMVLLYLLMAPTIIGLQLSHWFAAFFTLTLFTLAAIHLVWEGALWMANRLILLLGLRFLLLFFIAFEGLMDTGIGLILSGLAILGTIWLWMKLRALLLRWMEALAS